MAVTFNCYLDRFEGDMAVLLIEDREVAVPRALIPSEASEGDYLRVSLDVDERAREARAREIEGLQKRLQSNKDDNE